MNMEVCSMQYNKEVLLKIKALLTEQQKSYQDLSYATGISESLMGQMLEGTRVIKPERLIAIAHALNIDLSDILKTKDLQGSSLHIVLHGELKSRKSKRVFESVLYAIEDYLLIKGVR